MESSKQNVGAQLFKNVEKKSTKEKYIDDYNYIVVLVTCSLVSHSKKGNEIKFWSHLVHEYSKNWANHAQEKKNQIWVNIVISNERLRL